MANIVILVAMSYPVNISPQGRFRQLKPYHIHISTKEGEVGLSVGKSLISAKMIKFTNSSKPCSILYVNSNPTDCAA